MIDKENWVSMSSDVKGEIYEGLLQKNAEDVKSGAGQYFTPRPLIKAMVVCLHPEPKKTIADPCCGSGGFFLAAQALLANPNNYALDRTEKEFLKNETFYGTELVVATFKLCLMNLYLHNIGGLYGKVPPEQKKFLMGKQYSSEKRTEAFRGNQHTVKKSGSVQSEHNQKPMKTCERIAQENHSSASSVRCAEYYAHGVDVADELSPGFRDRFFREELHIPDYLLENLGKAKPEEEAEIFEEIKNYVPKPKKIKPNKVSVKQAEKAASNTIDENYDVPQKFLELYYRLHDAESLM